MSGQLARSDLEAFRSALAREAGLRFDDDKLPLLAEVLTTRMRQTGSKSVATYLERLTAEPEQLAELAPSLSVSETYFLRNRHQFQALAALLRAREASSTRHLRLLSAGCSSGEEAYSLAITVRETLRRPEEWTVSVLAVDLNPEAIEKARLGSYSRWSLRETPDVIRDKYFHHNNGTYAISDAVRGLVRFEQENLVRPRDGFWRREAFDIVFCRNVLMYFAPEASRQVVASIARALSPCGHLFLGHAENLRGLSSEFHLRRSHDTFFYERKGSQQPIGETSPHEPRLEPAEPPDPLPDDVSWFPAIARASSRIETLSRDARHGAAEPPKRDFQEDARPPSLTHPPQNDLAPAMDLMQQERFQEALRLLASAPASAAPEPDALLLRAMLLLSTGELAGAEELCKEILAVDELNAGAHCIMAICREHAGDHRGAIEHSQAAAYLDSEFAMPHLQLGRLARRSGDIATARRELGLALGLLPREDAARIILFGGGFSREALMQLCRGELKACGGTE